MNWLQIAINTAKDNAERAEDCLFSAGAQTVTLTDAADQPILEPGVNEVPIWNAIIITGLFNFDNNQQALLDSINGTPISLCRLPCVARVESEIDKQLASSSFTVVLPLLPVIPTTVAGI